MTSRSRIASIRRPRRRGAALLALGLAGALTLGLASTASASSLPTDTVVRVNNSAGGGATNDGAYAPSISGDGRYVAFRSPATNLVPGVADGRSRIYVTDTHTSTTSIVSVATNGAVGDGDSEIPMISLDGRYISFASTSTNLVDGGASGHTDIYVRDTCAGEATCTPSTVLVSAPAAGAHSDGASSGAYLSGNGRYVLFESFASNLIADDTNGRSDLFVRDTCAGIADCIPSTTRPILTHDGAESIFTSGAAGISIDGRYIAFYSMGTNIVPADSNGMYDVFVRDTCAGIAACTPSTTRVSVANDGSESDGGSVEAAISNDGRFVAFSSAASNLVAGDTNGTFDTFLRDTCAGASACTPSTTRTSIASDGSEANGSSASPRISGDGRYVAFVSYASNLIGDDTNGVADVFVHDTCANAPGCHNTTVRVSFSRTGVETDRHSDAPSISAGGAHIAFHSYASALVSGPDTMQYNVYVASYYQPPVVIVPPTNVTVTIGESATLSFLVSANPTLAWFRWETADSEAGPWTEIATTTVPRLTVTPAEIGVVYYRAAGQNFRGFLTTDPVTVTAVPVPVAVAPAVTAQPLNAAATVGESKTLSAAFSGTPTPTIQWQEAAASSGPWMNILGATAADLTVTPAAPGIVHYRAIGTNTAGSATTSAVTVTAVAAPTNGGGNGGGSGTGAGTGAAIDPAAAPSGDGLATTGPEFASALAWAVAVTALGALLVARVHLRRARDAHPFASGDVS